MKGHIHRRVQKTRDGKQRVLWYVVIDAAKDARGRRRQLWGNGYETRREAEEAQAELATKINQGTYLPPSKMNLERFLLDEWLPAVKTQLKSSTYDSYQKNLTLHVLPVLGKRSVQHLTPSHLNNLYQTLLSEGRLDNKGGLSAKSVRNIHGMLHKALADAVDEGIVIRNIAESAKAPKLTKAPKEMSFWRPEELRAFLDFVRKARLYAAWHVAAMTGMRRGEVLGLRWQDLDLDGGRDTAGGSSDASQRGLPGSGLDSQVAQGAGGRPRR